MLRLTFPLLMLLTPFASAVSRGAAWGTSDAWSYRVFTEDSAVGWYHHWQQGPIKGVSPALVEFVPTFWGPQKWRSWSERKREMTQHRPAHVLSFNEPDIHSQADLSPAQAVELHMKELWPLKQQFPHVRISSPQIGYNISWLREFMSEARARQVEPDFIVAHWYGAPKLKDFQRYVHTLHRMFPEKELWITEVGLSRDARASVQEARQFLVNLLDWADTQRYLTRIAWTGFFGSNAPPDGFISPTTALFNPDGTLNALGRIYAGYGGQ